MNEAKKRADVLNRIGSCGECRECCSNLAIDKLLKKEGDPCRFLAKDGSGCARYQTRPDSCRYFLCVWRFVDWPAEMRPDISGVMAYPLKEGPVRALRVVGRTYDDMQKHAEFIVEFAKRAGFAVTFRVVRTKQEIVWGNDEQTDAIIAAKKHLRIIERF